MCACSDYDGWEEECKSPKTNACVCNVTYSVLPNRARMQVLCCCYSNVYYPSVFSFHTLTVPSSEQEASTPGCLGFQLTLLTSVVCACSTVHSRVKRGSFGEPAEEGSCKHSAHTHWGHTVTRIGLHLPHHQVCVCTPVPTS